MHCSKCGNVLAVGVPLCGNCGAPQASSPQGQPPVMQQAPMPEQAPPPAQPFQQVPPQAPPPAQPFQQVPPQAPPPAAGQQYQSPSNSSLPSGGNKLLKIILFSVGGLVLLFALLGGILFLINTLSGGLQQEQKRLEAIGFECEITTLKDGFQDIEDEEQRKTLEESEIASHELLKCDDEERHYQNGIRVVAVSDAEWLIEYLFDAVCTQLDEQLENQEGGELLTGLIETAIQAVQDQLAEQLLQLKVGEYIYTAEEGDMDMLRELLDDEGIDYESHPIDDLSCDN